MPQSLMLRSSVANGETTGYNLNLKTNTTSCNIYLSYIIGYLCDANSAFVFLSTKLHIYLYTLDGSDP
jgi:hypothetical protein